MTSILINLSNHPTAGWSEAQLAASMPYGDLVDMPFPQVDPSIDEEALRTLVDVYAAQVAAYRDEHSVTVHLMGEMTFCFALINRLRGEGITCVASCTERMVELLSDGVKRATFQFVRFREYR